MHDISSTFHTRPIDTPLDAAEEWLDSTARWPLRILIAAVLCPIIFSFGGHTKFIFYWEHFTSGGRVGAHTWLALTPLLAIGLLVASRFVSSLQVRAACCALSGIAAFGILSFCTHWVVAAFTCGLVLVVAGNRAAKQFTLRRAPRIGAAIGGATLLILGCLDVNGSSMVGTLFTGGSWTGGGWMLCLGLLGMLAFALAGVGLVIPRLPRHIPSRAISISARLTLGWAPACLIFGRLSLGGSLTGIDATADLAGMTIAFKVFGIAYPLLIATATGVASWATLAMWKALDSEVIPEGLPPTLDETLEGRRKAVLTTAAPPSPPPRVPA